MGRINLKAGKDIVFKIPRNLFEDTLHFYRDILLMDVEVIADSNSKIHKSAIISFGNNSLRLETEDLQLESNIQLELSTNQINSTVEYFKANDVQIKNSEGSNYYLKDPAGNLIHLKPNS